MGAALSGTAYSYSPRSPGRLFRRFALLALGLTTMLGMALSSIPAVAAVAPGSTIVVTIPTNGSCSAASVVAHSLPSDDVSMSGSHIVLTRHVTSEIPDQADIQFTAIVDTATDGCRMQQPVTMRINGQPVSPYQNDISAGGDTLTITARAPLSRTVQPTDPGVVQAKCDNGDVVPPEVVLPEDTAAVTYSLGGDVGPGGVVTVTATAQDGYTFSDTPGWTISADRTTATMTIEFDEVDCPVPPQQLQPVDPGVVQASCHGGDVVPPEVVLPEDTAAVTYSLGGDVGPGGVVTVTATAQDGYAFIDTPGWTISADRTTATTEVALDEVDCPMIPEEVIPTDPGVHQASCDGGDVVPPEVVLPKDTAAVSYSLTGDVVPGNVVTVTATASEGFVFTPVDGWSLSEDHRTATREIQLDDADCTTPPPSTPGNGGGGTNGGGGANGGPGTVGQPGAMNQDAGSGGMRPLASTGVPEGTSWLVLSGAALVLIGGGMIFAVRRRASRG